jgi:alpha-galactosidase
MGTNTLAFRAVQHNTFYAADPDCVGVTLQQPWALNRQWLDLAARSGTMLMVSLAPDALTPDVTRDLRQALAIAAKPQPLGEPLDWDQSVYPTRWRLMGRNHDYHWDDPDGSDLP